MEDEIKNAESDSRVVRVENILEQYPSNHDDEEFLLNPCFGDPEMRGVLGGGYLTEEAFVKPKDFVHFSDRNYSFQKAGPRLRLAMKPENIIVAISLGGALCPGLNSAIRELVMSLWFNYGVRKVWGIKFGFVGILDENNWIELNPSKVTNIHTMGGAILGTHRGSKLEAEKVVDKLLEKGVNVFIKIAGFGTFHQMLQLKKAIDSKKLGIITACLPKTLDNDIPLIDRSFGFETTVEEIVKMISSAKLEAKTTPNSIAIVKAFGRQAGFTALAATNSSRDVNICLIPEKKFNLYGEYGLIEFVFKRLAKKGSCVILVSEGVALSMYDKKLCNENEKDSFGNKLYPDIF